MGTVFQIPWTYAFKKESQWLDKGIATIKELGFKTAAMALSDNAVNIDEFGTVTALNQNTTVFITAAIKDDPQRRNVMLNLKTVPLQPESLTLSINGEEGEIVLDKLLLEQLKQHRTTGEPLGEALLPDFG